MKNKAIALMGAIVLCSLFFVALQATTIAAEQDDYVLGIYGNANEDDTIDMRDLTYVKLIFFGKKPETELADAKYDGKINPLDFIQIKLIIVGKESELTLVDSADRIVTVSKPVERIIPMHPKIVTTVKSLGAKDKVVGVTENIKERTAFFPELSQLPSVGSIREPDYEMIIALEPDVVIQNAWQTPGELEEMLEPAGITVVRSGPCGATPMYAKEVKKLGYILGEKDRAEEFIDWYEDYVDTITKRVEGLSEEDKPRVFEYYGGEYGYSEGPPYGTFGKDNDAGNRLIEMAGGINIAGDLPGDWITVEPEWVTYQNPSIIIREVYVSISGPIMGYDIDDPSEVLAMREDIMSQLAFMPTDAVKEGEVYVGLGDIMERYWFVGIQYMAKWFHPELFEDLDPQAVHQEFLTEFQGLDYDLDEHGVFVYRPEKHPDGS